MNQIGNARTACDVATHRSASSRAALIAPMATTAPAQECATHKAQTGIRGELTADDFGFDFRFFSLVTAHS